MNTEYNANVVIDRALASSNAARLRKGVRSVYWQGDDAAEAVDFFAEHGAVALDRLWDDYRDVATYEGGGPEED